MTFFNINNGIIQLYKEDEFGMANTTTSISVNVPTDVIEEATSLFDSLGLNMCTVCF